MREWICKSCGKIFDPLSSNGGFDFTCPVCGANLTSPNGDTEKNTADE